MVKPRKYFCWRSINGVAVKMRSLKMKISVATCSKPSVLNVNRVSFIKICIRKSSISLSGPVHSGGSILFSFPVLAWLVIPEMRRTMMPCLFIILVALMINIWSYFVVWGPITRVTGTKTIEFRFRPCVMAETVGNHSVTVTVEHYRGFLMKDPSLAIMMKEYDYQKGERLVVVSLASPLVMIHYHFSLVISNSKQ